MMIKWRMVPQLPDGEPYPWGPGGAPYPAPEWSWIDQLERVETMGLDLTTPVVAECFRIAISASTGHERELLVYWLHHRDGGLPTHLSFGEHVEAFLLNDAGDTIDRLNQRVVAR